MKRKGNYSRGKAHYAWKGGMSHNTEGYILETCVGHPRAIGVKYGKSYVFQHILIAEKALGKPLPIGVEVHHVNKNRADNRHTNLVICVDRAYHKLLHRRQRVLELGGDPNTDKFCTRCKLIRPQLTFWKDQTRWDGLQATCKVCQN